MPALPLDGRIGPGLDGRPRAQPCPCRRPRSAKPAAAPLTASATQGPGPHRRGLCRAAGPRPRPRVRIGAVLDRTAQGGDLHHHYTGAIYAETTWIGSGPGLLHLQGRCPELQVQKLRIEIRPFASLPPASQAPVPEGAPSQRRPRALPQPAGTWSDKDYGNHFHLQPPPDQQFFSTFGCFGPASAYSVNRGLQGPSRPGPCPKTCGTWRPC